MRTYWDQLHSHILSSTNTTKYYEFHITCTGSASVFVTSGGMVPRIQIGRCSSGPFTFDRSGKEKIDTGPGIDTANCILTTSLDFTYGRL
jgi:hypothetical protein